MAKKQFKAESKRLLDLMINSIYTHKEIFLRELISNASDAEDKLAYKALTDDQVPVDRKDLKITIVPDKEMRTLTVSDNGVGMTKEELENNLGTIAKSGSFQFKQDLAKEEKGEDIDVIGQFGVGFYSAFMVADHVTVVSRAYGSDEAWMWQSDGADGYTVTQCEKDAPGSDVIMHLKANADEENYDQYLETYKLQELIKKYSDYIRYPIVMEVEDYRQKEKPADAGEDYKPEWELSITAGYNDSGLVGYCVEVQANGFGGVLTAVVGVNTNGEVTGVAVTDHRETVGVGSIFLCLSFSSSPKSRK